MPTGNAIDAFTKNKHTIGNMLEGIQISSTSSSASSTPDNTKLDGDSSQPTKDNTTLLLETLDVPPVQNEFALVDLELSRYPSEVPSANESETR